MNLSPENPDSLIQTRLNVSKVGISGVAIALIIISLWAISLGSLLSGFVLSPETVESNSLQNLGWKAGAIMCQTFLYTGLFITAHDAMHGVIFPKYPQINASIGSFSLIVYGLFSYDKLLTAHWQHHGFPACESDPDFHDGKHKNAIAWYFYFMYRYWSWWRLLGLVTAYNVMNRLFNVNDANLILFWIVPSLLSSVQLFYFGTFLPHQEPIGGYQNSFRTQSSYRPLLWSFLTCYHFGYHHEHHQHPYLAWWQLPAIAKKIPKNPIQPTA